VAASARVGNLIGSRSAAGAKRAAHASALLSVVVGLIVMIAMLAAKDVCLIAVTLIFDLQAAHRYLGIFSPMKKAWSGL
jgi:Na+-driven multidrug efflux pump